MTYRDKTETMSAEVQRLQHELTKTSSELARYKERPRTEIEYRSLAAASSWVAPAIGCGTIASLLLALAAAAFEAIDWHRTAYTLVALAATLALLAGYIAWRALPRREVRR